MEQDSPAKQFLAAVSKASQELETAIAHTYEEALKLNVQLTESARVQMEQTDASLEKELRLSTNLVLEDRQTLLSQLADLRQQELHVLADTGKFVREQLTGKLEELVGNFDDTIKTEVQSFQEKLSSIELSLSQKIDHQNLQLSEKITEFSQTIREEIQNRGKQLEDFEQTQRQLLQTGAETSAASITSLSESIASNLREEVAKLIDEMTASVSARDFGSSPADRISRLPESALAEDKVLADTANDLQQMQDMVPRFTTTCLELAQLQEDVHSTAVKNVTLRYKTELLSASQHSEDQLKLIASEVALTLKQYEKLYAERFEQRIAEFEKDAAQEVQNAISDQERAGIRMSATKDKELKDLYIGLRRGASDSLRATVTQTERAFETLFEEYKTHLESLRQQKSSELDQECKRATDELTRIFKNFDQQSTDIERQLGELESATSELDEFVSALSHADLDF